jgi:hypothetical protein
VLALAGSLVSVSSPRVGGVLIVIALLSTIADEQLGMSLGRRLTPERGSQNVVASAPEPAENKPVRLIITSNYDAGRLGISYRDRPRRAAAWLRTKTNGMTPGWLGLLVITLAWLLATAIARAGGARGTTIGLVQLGPTIVLVLALAALIDIASAPYGPAAGDNASGIAVALAIGAALGAAPPRHLRIELVLQGAGEGGGLGLRRYVRSHRRRLEPSNAVVLGIAPSGEGSLRWWVSDGPLIPLRYFARLRGLCGEVAATEPELHAGPHRGRGATPALPARAAGLPAISIGRLDDRGLAPCSHQPSDNADRINPDAVDDTIAFGLMLIDAIDSYVGRNRAAARSRPTPV